MPSLPLLLIISCACVAAVPDDSRNPSCLLQKQTDRQKGHVEVSPQQRLDQENINARQRSVEADPHRMFASAIQSTYSGAASKKAGRPDNGKLDMDKTKMFQKDLPDSSRHDNHKTYTTDFGAEYESYIYNNCLDCRCKDCAGKPVVAVAEKWVWDWRWLLILALFLCLICFLCGVCRKREEKHEVVTYAAVREPAAPPPQAQIKVVTPPPTPPQEIYYEEEPPPPVRNEVVEEVPRARTERGRIYYEEPPPPVRNEVVEEVPRARTEVVERGRTPIQETLNYFVNLPQRLVAQHQSPRPAVPVATVGVDTTGDGRANYTYTGVDRNYDGIPDALQRAPGRGVPVAAVGVDTTGDGRANYNYVGVDRNHDGIPDAFQTEPRAGVPVAAVGVDTTGDGRANYNYVGVDRNRDGIPDALQTPVAAVGVDTTGDGRANYTYVGVDRDRDGIPDALQASPRSMGTASPR